MTTEYPTGFPLSTSNYWPFKPGQIAQTLNDLVSWVRNGPARAYGSYRFTDEVSTSVTTSYTKVLGYTESIILRDFVMAANGVLKYKGATTVPCLLQAVLSCEIGTANTLVHYAFAKNKATLDDSAVDQYIATVNEHLTMALLWPITLAPEDEIEVHAKANKSATLTTDHLIMVARQL